MRNKSKRSTVSIFNSIKQKLKHRRNHHQYKKAQLKPHQKRKLSMSKKWPLFSIFLILSYSGIIWISISILSANITNRSQTFIIARFLIQKLCSICNIFAFVSFWKQAHGLIGEHGIQPIQNTLAYTTLLSKSKLNINKYLYQPTIFWLNQSDIFLHFILFLGTISSLFILLNIFYSSLNCIFFITCAICYSSLKIVSVEFLQLQWDAMLIEVNLICIFCELDSLLSGTFILYTTYDSFCSRISIILFAWLHYRLMICSGMVKMTSGCKQWRNGSAMGFHFWTQPLPTPTAYYIYSCIKNCPFFIKIITYGSLVGEIFIPFLILVPFRIARIIAGCNTFLLMLSIFLSGNFGFFNILTICLTVICVDDELFLDQFSFLVDFKYFGWENEISDILHVFSSLISLIWLVLIMVASLRSLWYITYTRMKYPSDCWKMFSIRFGMWNIVNSYGLFARMTTFRHEIIIEGTMDKNWRLFTLEKEEKSEAKEDSVWLRYEFKYKPGDINCAPPICLFHLPRLDWRLWFLPLKKFNVLKNKWFVKFIRKLMLNGCLTKIEHMNTDTLSLLKYNPFEEYCGRLPLKAIRVRLFEYQFVSEDEIEEDKYGAKAKGLIDDDLLWEMGKWWMRRDLHELYMPIMTRETSRLFTACEIEKMEEMEK